MALPPPWLDETCVVQASGKHEPRAWTVSEGDTPGFACRHCHKSWVWNGKRGYSWGYYEATWERNGRSAREKALDELTALGEEMGLYEDRPVQ